MTMTREKIEELKRLHAAMTNCDSVLDCDELAGFCVPKSMLDQFESLLALAERALEPQGQALSAVMAMLADHEALEGMEAWLETQELTVNIGPIQSDHDEHIESSAGWLMRLVRTAMKIDASQIALPAGSVPEGAAALNTALDEMADKQLSAAYRAGMEGDEFDMLAAKRAIAKSIRALSESFSPAETLHSDDIAVDRFAAASPAVAQPDELAKLKDPHAVHVNMLRGTIAKIGMRELAHVHGEEMSARWQRFEEWEASQAAVAQPVADERERK